MSQATDKKLFRITCGHCDKRIDANYCLQHDDRYYCLDCYISNYRNLLLDYGYKPSPRFNCMSFEKNPLYMGIELEIEASTERDYDDGNSDNYDEDNDEYYDDDEENASTYVQEQAHYIMKNYPCYIKYDGSLNDCGMEIVTHPCSLKYHKKIFNWEKLFKYLKKNKFTSYENNRCGLHIHISKEFFKPEDYLKFNIFFDKDYNRIKRFAKRNKTNYCMKIDQSQTQTIAKLKKNTRIEDWYDHYKSIFFGNYRTIELRIFRGTLNIDRFNATLDFTEGLSYFIKSYSLAFFIKATKKQIWFNFIAFLKNSRRYSKLLRYLQKENLLDCNLKDIPLKGERLKSKISQRPLTDFLMTDEIRGYLLNKIIPELKYYFEDFNSYEIYHRGDLFYFDNKCLPLHFEKIVIENALLKPEMRYSILTHFLNYGYYAILQDKNIEKRITTIDDLARSLNVDFVKIEGKLDREQKKAMKELKAERELQDFYRSKLTNEIRKETIKELDKKKNKHLQFTITKTV